PSRRYSVLVVPALRAAGAFRSGYAGTTLREHLGLGVAVNQYQGA
ncbi:LLM class flavin-dependent oxidoreductase, partial [Amycolatopsis mediterranei]